MKNAVWFATPLLFAVSCAQPTGNAANAEPSDASAKAANTRPDGSVIDESKPHDHTAANAHDKPMAMDMATMSPAAGDSEATLGSKAAMMKMMHGMPAYTGDADVDFNKQMRGHHVAAVEMAEVQLKFGKDPASRTLATEIIAAQKKEIAEIDAWLAKRGQ